MGHVVEIPEIIAQLAIPSNSATIWRSSKGRFSVPTT
jgi:hypothetical protein